MIKLKIQIRKPYTLMTQYIWILEQLNERSVLFVFIGKAIIDLKIK